VTYSSLILQSPECSSHIQDTGPLLLSLYYFFSSLRLTMFLRALRNFHLHCQMPPWFFPSSPLYCFNGPYSTSNKTKWVTLFSLEFFIPHLSVLFLPPPLDIFPPFSCDGYTELASLMFFITGSAIHLFNTDFCSGSFLGPATGASVRHIVEHLAAGVQSITCFPLSVTFPGLFSSCFAGHHHHPHYIDSHDGLVPLLSTPFFFLSTESFLRVPL